MKLGRYRESSKPVAICGWPALFGFMKLDSAEIPRIKKSALTAANLTSKLRGEEGGYHV